MSARVIAVVNRKGGVGKTTTSVNVAAELGSRGRRVLLVDLDPQGHAGLGLGVTAQRSETSVHHIFRDAPVDLSTAVKTSDAANVDVLPAERDFQVHDSINDPLRLVKALAPFAETYDEIVLDTSPSIDVTTVAALAASDHVLIPTQLQHLAYDGVVRFAAVLLRVATLLNRRFVDLAIVPIQIDARVNLQRMVLAQLLKEFGHQRIFRGIRTDISLAESFGSRTAVKYYRPHCRAAADYALLTDDILRTGKINGLFQHRADGDIQNKQASASSSASGKSAAGSFGANWPLVPMSIS